MTPATISEASVTASIDRIFMIFANINAAGMASTRLISMSWACKIVLNNAWLFTAKSEVKLESIGLILLYCDQKNAMAKYA